MKFTKEQRVTVPGSAAQGVVVDAVESVPGFPVYALRWLTEAGELMNGTCGEGDLAAANVKPTVINIATRPARLIVKPAALAKKLRNRKR